MICELKAQFIMLHYLKSKSECKIKDLICISNEIQSKFPEIYVDVSYTSISCAAKMYSDMFYIDNDCIKRNSDLKEYLNEDIVRYFDYEISSEMHKKILEVIDNAGNRAASPGL